MGNLSVKDPTPLIYDAFRFSRKDVHFYYIRENRVTMQFISTPFSGSGEIVRG